MEQLSWTPKQSEAAVPCLEYKKHGSNVEKGLVAYKYININMIPLHTLFSPHVLGLELFN